MKNIILALLATILLIPLLTSCVEDQNPTGTNPPVTPTEGWQVDRSYYRSQKILLNARVSDDSTAFQVAGLHRMSLYRTDEGDSVVTRVPYNARAIDSRPAMSDRFVAFTGKDESQFVVNSLYYGQGTVSNYGFRFVHYFTLGDSPDYSNLATIPVDWYQTPVGAFNNRDQFLTVVSDTSYAMNTNMSFCLVDLNPKKTEVSDATLMEFDPDIERIPYETEVSTDLSFIGSYKQYFFVSIRGDQIDWLRIAPSGEVQQTEGINSGISDMFSQGDTLYAYSPSAQTIYWSADDGMNWNAWISQFPIDQPQFFYIDNKLCAYIYSQIFWLDFENSRLRELDNTNLSGMEITAVNKFNKRIWVSTLSGMFYKKPAQFFELRQTQSKSAQNLRFEVNQR